MNYHFLFFLLQAAISALMLIIGATMLPDYDSASFATFVEMTPCDDVRVAAQSDLRELFQNKYIGYDCTIEQCAKRSAACLDKGAFGYKAPYYYNSDITKDMLECIYLQSNNGLGDKIKRAMSRAEYYGASSRRDVPHGANSHHNTPISFTQCYPSMTPAELIPRLRKGLAPWSSGMLYPGIIFAAVALGINLVVGLVAAIVMTYTGAKHKVLIQKKKCDAPAECGVCLSEIAPGTHIYDMCHCFHAECVAQWLLEHGACPTCRAMISI